MALGTADSIDAPRDPLPKPLGPHLRLLGINAGVPFGVLTSALDALQIRPAVALLVCDPDTHTPQVKSNPVSSSSSRPLNLQKLEKKREGDTGSNRPSPETESGAQESAHQRQEKSTYGYRSRPIPLTRSLARSAEPNQSIAAVKMSIQYRRLDPSRREIRLLEIQSARSLSDPVECRLVTVRLTDELSREYIALSSLYGDAAETEKIFVGGHAVTITAHLAQALKQVRAVFYPTISQRFQRTPARRPHGAPRWLRQLFGLGSSRQSDLESRCLRVWCDFLCVNQRDDVEKSKQHTDMRNIYRNAELVVGWLGDKRDDTDEAMAALARIEDAMPPHWGDPGDREKHPEDYAPFHKWAVPIASLWAPGPDGEIPFLMPHWAGANDFMGRSYFQRRWILEELAMARFPTFLIGDTIVPWKQVLRLNRMMEEFKYHPSDIFPANLSAMIAELPLETAHKLLDEFAKREALEEAQILKETGSSRATSSTRSTDTK
ncbi:heterokaryon incompatibility protein [Colletotrichum lupini]|uniref:Heterokaryon incompatibility protein n=1 Tax=Colletotrichum lupini TaxID=145971 RepID=A0A9Q8T345_9PEZI|nr:heterokaryon incompatibility protein [Colletotrichum lupini]UQC88439.1 heterokaryon incompatibility protein [Colletotrichum lupini]